MNHELSPKPEEVYDNYTKAHIAAKDMEQVIEEERSSVFSGELPEILHRAAQRAKDQVLAESRLRQTEQEAKEYAEKNLPELKEQAVKEARSKNKNINPL